MVRAVGEKPLAGLEGVLARELEVTGSSLKLCDCGLQAQAHVWASFPLLEVRR